jgi:hypothetical protein
VDAAGGSPCALSTFMREVNDAVYGPVLLEVIIILIILPPEGSSSAAINLCRGDTSARLLTTYSLLPL